MTREETFWGWIYLALQLLVIPGILRFGNQLLPTPLSTTVLNFLYYCINFTAVISIFRLFLKKNFTLMKLRFGYALQSAFFAFAVYCLSTLVLSRVCAWVYPSFINVNDSNIAGMTAENYTLMAIGTVFLVPVAEETLYRGLLFQGLYNRSRAAAYALSTLVFCAIHVVGYIGTYEPVLLLLCFAQYIPAGLALAWSYSRADTIAAPILLHMSINALGIYAVR